MERGHTNAWGEPWSPRARLRKSLVLLEPTPSAAGRGSY